MDSKIVSIWSTLAEKTTGPFATIAPLLSGEEATIPAVAPPLKAVLLLIYPRCVGSASMGKTTPFSARGCIWGDVDMAGAEYSLAAVDGTVNHTGAVSIELSFRFHDRKMKGSRCDSVGRSHSWGGYGYLSSRYGGLSIDNLLYATMVLADGRIVKASKDENPDLFWAVRGAGQEFGVTVEFCFQAHPQPNPVTAGLLIFPTEKADQLFDFTNYFHEELLDDSSTIGLGL
ncbi:hypothetical protein AJ78_04070 [Emergomyces pasteurianus Ep9510]|uniref:FAD-binding PCMH-type domain-containing protein n=1 Tax=Emergomyces pasteurianus Ep9510 TaxID=1447872 RepID=A0A1J9PI63_9EURO|nr:hypothetical protein AJ78_04070 [Emergomyces pasteurianus Ep9510]